jgi:serine/threonine-protein kinase
VDPQVAELVRQERLVEAAALARSHGDAATASTLYERACDWKNAAEEALRACDPGRALDLAAEAGDESLADRATSVLASDAGASSAAALRLARRGRVVWAARVLEAAGLDRDAAASWAQAGHSVRAAQILERLGETVAAARVLESAVRRDPAAFDAALSLGRLLARFGKDEAALRTLQRVPPDTPLRREALAAMSGVLRRLGLADAAEESERELAALGGPPTDPPATPDATKSAPIPMLFGRYAIVREVASSSNARVLECRDVVRDERVAVKTFAAGHVHGAGRDAIARFEREVRALQALDHPNVVPLRDFVPEGPSIVLEWMPGGALEAVLASGPLAPSRSIEVACAILSALGEAHRLGILHRDVKPANVLFDFSGGVRLSDFGAAHLADSSATTTAGIIGTRGYMSPEQREGHPATIRSDLYSVGVLLREMLTGQPPTAESSDARPSELHSELDARHEAVLRTLTERDPELRPTDAFDARARLLAIPWPASLPARLRPREGASRTQGDSSETIPPARLRPRLEGGWIDALTLRTIECVNLDDRVLERARRFALADHPALQTVLRIDPSGALWLAAPRGRPLDRPLTQRERDRMEAALSALHGAGEAHGYVDVAHVFLDADEGPVLRFEPERPDAATAETDLAMLARLP